MNAQIMVGCSNGQVTISQYQTVEYPDVARRAAFDGIYNNAAELTIKPGGEFSYRILMRMSDDGDYLFRESIVNSLSGWKFVNETGHVINLKLNIIFELSGTVHVLDNKIQNRIIFGQDYITIKVAASRVIPVAEPSFAIPGR